MIPSSTTPRNKPSLTQSQNNPRNQQDTCTNSAKEELVYFQDLPDEVKLNIFQHTLKNSNFKEIEKMKLPLVCKSWNNISKTIEAEDLINSIISMRDIRSSQKIKQQIAKLSTSRRLDAILKSLEKVQKKTLIKLIKLINDNYSFSEFKYLSNGYLGDKLKGNTLIINQTTLEMIQISFDKANKLFEEGRINTPDEDGNTPLISAIRIRNFAVARELIKLSADVKLKNKEGNTALHILAMAINPEFKERSSNILAFCKKETYEMAKLLVKKGASIDLPNNQTKTPFELAIENVNLTMIQFLAEKNPNLINKLDKYPMQKLLNLAVKEGDCEVVEFLCKKDGIDINCASTDIAYGFAHNSAYEFACEFITNIFIFNNFNSFTDNQKDKFTPLELAASTGNLEIFKILMVNKAKFEVLNDEAKLNLLHSAVKKNDLKVFNILVENWANIHSKIEIRSRLLNLHLADGHGNLKIIKFLVNEEFDINLKNNDGNTPLHLAALFNKLEAAKFLVENKADVNSKNNDGNTPLHLAALFNKLEVVKFLVENGADTALQDDNEQTALDLAIRNNYTAIADYLTQKMSEADNNG